MVKQKDVLEELSKLDPQWRKIALKICGNKQDADDVVNDMYLKMHKRQPDTFNISYISYAMYHIFLHGKASNKYKNTLYLEDMNTQTLEGENDLTEDRIRIDNILDELGLLDREILLHTHEKSLRKTAEELFMSHSKLHYKKQNALDKLKNTEGVKNWKNER